MSEQPETAEAAEADPAYQAGYEQGKEDAAAEAMATERRLRCLELRTVVQCLASFPEYSTGDAIDAVHRAVVRVADRIGED